MYGALSYYGCCVGVWLLLFGRSYYGCYFGCCGCYYGCCGCYGRSSYGYCVGVWLLLFVAEGATTDATTDAADGTTDAADAADAAGGATTYAAWVGGSATFFLLP